LTKMVTIDNNSRGVQSAAPSPAALGAVVVEFPVCLAPPEDFAAELALVEVVVAAASLSKPPVTVMGIYTTLLLGIVSSLEPGKLAEAPPKLSWQTASELTVHWTLMVKSVSVNETS